MPTIRVGSCVGVLYWSSSCSGACLISNNRCFCVHNGRFKYAIYGNQRVHQLTTPLSQMPDAVVISHWTIQGGQPRLETNRKITRIADIRLTPDLSSSSSFYCANFRRTPSTNPANVILPGTCFGVYYRTNGGRDIKNGRYLFWLDQNGNRHCVIYRRQTTPYLVYYYHYNIQRNPNTGIISLRPEITYKYEIIDTFRTTL
ncbi:MAG: hypothetical protein WB502_15120 [Thermoactinomyces sp.]